MPLTTTESTDPAPSRLVPAVDLAGTTRSLPSLTGLRWVAALAIFSLHLGFMHPFTGDAHLLLARLTAGAQSGVSLFFILSGLVLTWSDNPGTRKRVFWRRRFARVYPLYLATLLLTVILGSTFVSTLSVSDPGGLLANVFLINTWSEEWRTTGNPTGWSLGCEAFFYALFPLIIPFARRLGTRGLWAATAIALAVILLLPAVSVALGLSGEYYWSPVSRLPEFVLGILVGRLVRSGAWRGPGVLVSVGLVVAGLAACLRITPPYADVACTVIGYVCLLAALARVDIADRRSVLAGPVAVWLGEVSFAFYLVHYLVLQSAKALWQVDGSIGQGFAFTAVTLVCSVGAAAALHHGVERPAQRWIAGKRR
jgi:peptidoglycan/LPS O-acetylase OafA/YrhL